MRRLQAAFIELRTVVATYVREDGLSSTRRIEPRALVINWPAWYLLARDTERDATRTFRLDRFRSVEAEPVTFTSMAPAMARTALEVQGVTFARV